MKQYVYLFFGAVALFFSGLNSIYAQCTPDPDFDPEDIVNPLPETNEFPDLGIPDTACISEDFSTLITFVSPDTITISGVLRNIDSIVVTGDGINGLPNGLAANCNPSSCSFLPGVPGCIGIEGIPDDAAGVYELTISVSIFLDGFFIGLPFTIPDGNLVPGQYLLNLREAGDPACVPSSVIEGTSAGLSLNMAPNPASTYTDLMVNSIGAQSAQVRLFDATGRLFRTAEWHLVPGENRYRLETNDLPVGLYTAVIMTGAKEGASLRLLVQR
ncbi:MAG: T9SS type A sorting domain-containing protein [Bacteroidota bacterium]